MRLLCSRFVLLALPLLLTACGEGWEAQRTTEHFPYGNQRTAGSGVIYVRAKMLPEKELVVEQKSAEAAPAEKIQSGDKIFSEAQKKGSSVAAPPPAVEKVEDKKVEIKADEKVENTQTAAEKKASAVAPAAGKVEAKPVTVEKATETPPERRMDQNQDDAPFVPEKVEPHAGTPQNESSLIGVPGKGASLDIVEIPEEVSLDAEANRSVMPPKEIKSPKTDLLADYVGQRSLEEIYSNPF